MVSAVVTTGTSIAITYNEDVTCGATTDAAFKYSDTGTSSGGAINSGSCTTSGDVLTLTGAFDAPQGNASIVYTAPGSPTDANAVSDTADSTAYTPTQTLLGSPTPIS